MADLETLRLSITADANAASAGINTLIESLTSLKQAMNGFKATNGLEKALGNISTLATGVANAINTLNIDSGFSRAVTEGLSNIVTAVNSVSDEEIDRIERLGNALRRLPNRQLPQTDGKEHDGGTAMPSMAGVSNSLKSTYASVNNTIGKITKAVSKMSKTFSMANTPIGKFVSSLARVAKMRLLRSIISTITSGASTGLKNLAKASSEANATLSQLSSASLTLKNSLGGALYSALAGVVSILQTIANAAVSAMNWINMLFSALGGKTTFKKATATTEKYADSLGGAAGSAKALKQELMGFDEINSLSPDSGGGGGGGGSGSLDYGSMFKESAIDADLLEAIETADFTKIGEKLADKINNALSEIDWENIITKGANLGKSLATFINGAIAELDFETIGSAIAGVVNTGLTTVNTFVKTTDWGALGEKIKGFVMNAVSKIEASDVGNFISAKIQIALGTVAGLLPDSYAEWKTLTDWISEAIKKAVQNVRREDVAKIIRSVIRGGLAMITSLGENHVFSNIAGTVLDAITDALNDITPEEVADACEAILSELGTLAGRLLTFTLDVMKVAIKLDSPLTTGVTAYGLYALLSKTLPFFGLRGYTNGIKGLELLGGIYFALDTVVKVGSVIESVKNGDGVSWQDIANIVGSALTSAGLTVMMSNWKAGLIVLGVGVIIKAIASTEITYEDTGALPTEVMSGDYIEALSNSTAFWKEIVTSYDFSGMEEAPQTLADALKVIYGENYDVSNLETAMQGVVDVFAMYSGMDTSLVDLQTLIGLMFPETYDVNDLFGLADGTQAVLTAFKQFNTGNGEFSSFEEFLSAKGIAGFYSATQTAQEGLENVAAAAEKFADQTDMEIPTDSLEDVSMATDEIAASMQATGEQAEELAEKIIEIPSDIVYNLELSNYQQVMTQLDDLKEAVSDAGTFGAFGFKAAFYDIGAWVTDNVITPIMDAFSGIDLASAGRKMMRTLKNGMRAIQLPKFKITWDSNTSTADVMGEKYTISIPTPKISTYATGGYLTAGELFVANEAGPELVGRIGSKSAVANEAQIGDAIFKYMDAHAGNQGADANALASALVSAMKAAGLGAIYLDGKMLGNSINREAKRSGKPVINF